MSFKQLSGIVKSYFLGKKIQFLLSLYDKGSMSEKCYYDCYSFAVFVKTTKSFDLVLNFYSFFIIIVFLSFRISKCFMANEDLFSLY